jgi:hypothetical protein
MANGAVAFIGRVRIDPHLAPPLISSQRGYGRRSEVFLGFVGRFRQSHWRVGKYLVTGLGYGDRMFELRRERPVAGYRGPAVRKDLHGVFASVDHRFDCKKHAFAENGPRARRAVMQNAGRGVKNPPQTMAAKIPNDGATLALGIDLDGVTDITQGRAGFDHLDTAHQTIMGNVHQARGFYRDFADPEHSAGIAEPAIENDRDVDIHDIALDQFARAGNAMTDDVVYRRADRLRKTLVIQRCGNGVVVENELMAKRVQFLGRHARLHVGCYEVEGFGR